eukprot:8975730-Heterocapsa_arctica.AAC.1
MTGSDEITKRLILKKLVVHARSIGVETLRVLDIICYKADHEVVETLVTSLGVMLENIHVVRDKTGKTRICLDECIPCSNEVMSGIPTSTAVAT